MSVSREWPIFSAFSNSVWHERQQNVSWGALTIKSESIKNTGLFGWWSSWKWLFKSEWTWGRWWFGHVLGCIVSFIGVRGSFCVVSGRGVSGRGVSGRGVSGRGVSSSISLEKSIEQVLLLCNEGQQLLLSGEISDSLIEVVEKIIKVVVTFVLGAILASIQLGVEFISCFKGVVLLKES